MVAQHHRVDRTWAHAKARGEVHAKAQAVEVGAGTQHAVVTRQAARNVRKRIRRIGHHENDGVRRCLDDARNQAFEDAAIGVEKLQPAGGIAAVDSAPGLLIDAGGDHDERRARKVIEITVPDIDQWRQRSTVANIGCDSPGALARPIDQHDLAGRAAHDECQRACRTDRAGPDNSNFHRQLLDLPCHSAGCGAPWPVAASLLLTRNIQVCSRSR